LVYGAAISTYPLLPNGQRDGDPICDRFYFQLHTNRSILAVADGCNWGPRPLQAAARATESFVTKLNQKQAGIYNLADAAYHILSGFATAHLAIIEDKTDMWDAGSTTLIGGMVLELQDLGWGFICGSVGDCKAFHWSHETKIVKDITIGNRQNLLDARDPGGRLGPYVAEGEPDLRNLAVFYCPCSTDDIIFMVSDGVHDNIDPQQLGLNPKDIQIEAESWADAEKLFADATMNAKTEYRNKLLTQQFEDLEKKGTITPQNVTKMILEYCSNITSNSRKYMELYPTRKQPSDCSEYPGKMDHTTCLALKVGMVSLEHF